MDSIRRLEKTVAAWLRDMPHLPNSNRKWLADNAWWLAGIGAILGAFGAIVVLSGTLFLGGLLTPRDGFASAAITGIALTAVLISVATLIIVTILLGMAVTPLREHSRRGWDYLFITLIIEAVSAVVGLILAFNIPNLIGNVISVLIGSYLLFEIYEYFGGDAIVTKKSTSDHVTPTTIGGASVKSK